MNHKILVVDDEPANTRMLERVFRNHFDVITAQSGAEGMELLTVHDIALIVSDQRMPGMSGVEFLKRSAELRPNCVRIILTGYTDSADLVDALNSNVVYKYVTKPWVADDLLQTVKRGLSHHETIKAQHRLNSENARLRERLQIAEDSFLTLCSEMLRQNDEQSAERAQRLRDMGLILGKAMDLQAPTLDILSLTALLHGLANFSSPAANQGEQSGWRERVLELLGDFPTLQDAVVAIRYLPEHFDGSGSPEGLSGIQIPLSSRIVAVLKAFDMMILPAGVEPLSHDEALDHLQSMAGRQLDPSVVKAFADSLTLDQMRSIIPDRLVSIR